VAPAGASIVIPLADDDLIAGADVIVLGRVTAIESHRDPSDQIETYVTVSVDEVLKGLLPGATVTVRELGGQVGDRIAWVFANPQFAVGERMVLFMNQRPDGTLRTHHYFLGKFAIVTDPASGDLMAVRGRPRNVTVISPPVPTAATLPTADAARGLDDFTRRIRGLAGAPRPWGAAAARAMPFLSAAIPGSGTVETHQEFTFLTDANGTRFRWNEPDGNVPVTMRVYSTGEPLAPTLGFEQTRAALRAWGQVPTSSFRFAEGPAITTSGLGGFAANGVNAISFRDPLNQIQDPTVTPFGCGGVLAIAGISSATTSGGVTINGLSFARALEGDVVVANGWEHPSCNGIFYQNLSNFTEVLTHELGHVLGLGHSTASGFDPVSGLSFPTMRATANFDGRHAALHADDRNGVTFIYPGRTLTVVKNGPGSGTVSSATDGIECGSRCSAGFAPGIPVALLATPDPGSSFGGWVEPACASGTVMMPLATSASVTCTALFVTAPDLVVTALTAPTVAVPGTTIQVLNTVRNNGADAGPFNVGIYLSSSPVISTADGQLLVSRRVSGGLGFNQVSTETTSVPIPADTPPGTYFIGAIADSDDEIDEGSGEGNNTRAAVGATVIARPDLVVTALSAPAAAGTGLNISASATVANLAQANVPAGPSTLAFYLSTDAVLDAGDLRLAQTRAIPQLSRNAASGGVTVLTIPADLDLGTYFLIARADDLETVFETNEGNNTRATATAIAVRRPDLAVISVTAPAAAAPGGSVNVTHVVRNVALAPGNAGATTSRLWLSDDNVFGGDVELGVVAVGPLAAATQAAVTRSVAVPDTTPVGTYWIFAQANALDTVIEADAPALANNVRSTATPIVIGPDLVVTAATAAPATTGPGLTVRVTHSVRNQGGQAAGAFTVGIYLSTDNGYDAGDTLLATRPVTGLGPALTSAAVTPVVLPSTLTAGSYFLIVRADVDGVVTEAHEANNTRAVPVTVARADLAVTVVTAPAVSAPGATVSVTHVVRNVAPPGGGAPATTSRLFLSADDSLDAADVALLDVPVGPLAGGVQVALARDVQIPAGTAPGRYRILAQANALNTVLEADSPAPANNVRASTAPIVIGPDLTIAAAVATPAATAPGMTVNVSHVARNAGGQAAAAFDVAIYLSGDATLDGDDTLLATRRVATGLRPAATSPATTPIVLPASLSAGSYFLIVRADAASEVIEADETNNTRIVPVTVVRPDLAVLSVVAPAAGAPGLNVNVTHVVRNVSPAAGRTPATTSRLYLSSDAILDGGDVPLLDVPVVALTGGVQVAVTRSVQIPPGTPVGQYWIIAQANALGTVLEADSPEQANNVRASAAPISIGPDPMMWAASVTPAATAPGHTISVGSVARNLGGQATVPFTLGIYLSTDGALSTGTDVLLGTRQVATALAPGGLSSGTMPVTLPANLAAGTYFVVFWADSGQVNADANVGNNLLARPLTIVRPDLTVTAVSVAPAATAPGASVNVTHIVRNAAVAAGRALPTVSRLYLSLDATLDAGDVPLLDVPVGALAGGGQAAVPRSVQIPAGTAPGVYRILAEANATGAVVEAEDANNVGASAPFLVGPDLVVTAATAPTAVKAGASVSVSTTVRNQGGQVAPPSLVRFVLVSLGGAEVPLAATRAVPSLLPGAVSGPMATAIAIPADVPIETHVIRVVADADGAVAEADEGNNTRTTGHLVVSAPLLAGSP
jgi:subtilase family serine protease